MIPICRQNRPENLLAKRAVFKDPEKAKKPAEAPPGQVKLEKYRQEIEDKTAPELMAEFRNQTNKLWKKQETIQELLEDFSSDKTISQVQKNAMIKEISDTIDKNRAIVLSEDMKFALGSHMKPGKGRLEEWGTKISLMAGSVGATAENMNEKASLGDKIKGAIKWIKMLVALITGKAVSMARSAVSAVKQKFAPAETSIEPPSAEAKELKNITIVENRKNASDGYVTITATVGGKKNVKRLIKHDGSEIREKRDGPAVVGETNDLQKYILKRRGEIQHVQTLLEIRGATKSVSFMNTLVTSQNKENKTEIPVDVLMLINDNWNWLITQDPYDKLNTDQRFQALTDASKRDEIISNLKKRYKEVRTQKGALNQARRQVSQKLEETANSVINNFAKEKKGGADEKELRRVFRWWIAKSRSKQKAAEVYSYAQVVCQNAAEKAGAKIAPKNYRPYASVANAAKAQTAALAAVASLKKRETALKSRSKV